MIESQAAVFKESSQNTVHDGGAYLALDVITDDWHPGIAELSCPLWIRGDEDGNGIDEGHTCVNSGLSVVALSVF